MEGKESLMVRGKEVRYLEFDRGSLYGPKVTEEIKESDYFIDCYKKAASQTIEIVTNKRKENFKIKNIIAFLGNRGQGKTSMMRSFVNALKSKNKVLFGESFNRYDFITLDIVDPSTFEDCSNVLDVILSQLLDKIIDVKITDANDLYEKKNYLMQAFNNLYNQINIIKDKSLLNKNFDIYEGSIETLLTINQITKFKKNLNKLIYNALNLLNENFNNTPILVIPIDDIDIDLSNCYETVETLRKYLNIPDVLIIMAAKLEQLHEGIRLENLKKVKATSLTDSERLYEDIYNMATKYLLKLLPQNRRIHIPEIVNSINSLQYDTYFIMDDKIYQNGLESMFSEFIYSKTSILILCSNQVKNYLLNGNLRDIVDLYSCLYEMETPDKESEARSKYQCYLINLEKLKDYFLNNWCTNNLTYKSARLIRKLYYNGGYYKNHTLIQMLCELEPNDSESKKELSNLLKLRGKKELFYDLSDISYYLNKIENHNHTIDVEDTDKFVYAIKMCYTLIMHQLRYIDEIEREKKADSDLEEGKLIKFIGGRILKNEVLNRAKNEEGKEIELNESISEAINNKLKDKYKKAKEAKEADNIVELLLLATTSFDKKRNIYFYNPENRAIKEFYIDPFLFFVNCLNLEITKKFKNNDKGGLYDGKDLKEEILKNKKELEDVAKTVICNFQIYDFYIDYLDIRYFPVGEVKLNCSSVYKITRSWLEQLKSDLLKQNNLYFKNNELIKSLERVIEIINDLSEKINIEIDISYIGKNGDSNK